MKRRLPIIWSAIQTAMCHKYATALRLVDFGEHISHIGGDFDWLIDLLQTSVSFSWMQLSCCFL